jgi:hypothetical protein
MFHSLVSNLFSRFFILITFLNIPDPSYSGKALVDEITSVDQRGNLDLVFALRTMLLGYCVKSLTYFESPYHSMK